MVCPNCKSELSAESQFCLNCGQTVSASGEQNTESLSYWNAVEQEAAENDRIRTDSENQFLQELKKKNQLGMAALLVFAVVGYIVFYAVCVYPSQRYTCTIELFDNGEYSEAMAVFEDLSEYKDFRGYILRCQEAITEQRYQVDIA